MTTAYTARRGAQVNRQRILATCGRARSRSFRPPTSPCARRLAGAGARRAAPRRRAGSRAAGLLERAEQLLRTRHRAARSRAPLRARRQAQTLLRAGHPRAPRGSDAAHRPGAARSRSPIRCTPRPAARTPASAPSTSSRRRAASTTAAPRRSASPPTSACCCRASAPTKRRSPSTTARSSSSIPSAARASSTTSAARCSTATPPRR